MNWKTLNGLLTSRKFWLALVTAIAAIVMYLQGAIGAAELADALTALAGILMGSIALEDAAEKYGGKKDDS